MSASPDRRHRPRAAARAPRPARARRPRGPHASLEHPPAPLAEVVAEDERSARPPPRSGRPAAKRSVSIGWRSRTIGASRGQRADPARDPVRHDDDRVDHAGREQRQLVVVQVGVRDLHHPRAGVAPGERRARDRVVGEHGVARERQLGLPVGDRDPAALDVLGHRPQLGGAEDRLVAEPLELARDREGVGLGATRVGERLRPDDDAQRHRSSALRRCTWRTIARTADGRTAAARVTRRRATGSGRASLRRARGRRGRPCRAAAR